MKKYKVYARLDIYEDIVELEENLTEDEVDEALFAYVNGFLDWNYKEISDVNEGE